MSVCLLVLGYIYMYACQSQCPHTKDDSLTYMPAEGIPFPANRQRKHCHMPPASFLILSSLTQALSRGGGGGEGGGGCHSPIVFLSVRWGGRDYITGSAVVSSARGRHLASCRKRQWPASTGEDTTILFSVTSPNMKCDVLLISAKCISWFSSMTCTIS